MTGISNASAETEAYVPKVLGRMGVGAMAPALSLLNASALQNVLIHAPVVNVSN
jgi:hypothetical protein